MNKEEADKRAKENPLPQSNRGYKGNDEEKLFWGVLLFGLIGATITTFAVTHLRSTVDSIYAQLSRSQAPWKSGRSSWTNFQEEKRKRYYRRMQEEFEAEMERVERIRRMQSVFNRQKNKKRRSYDSWQQHGPDPHHEHFQRNDWYWKEDTFFGDHGTNSGQTFKAPESSPLSHHYSVLGLDRRRTKPYTDAEIKSAFRTKAKEFHPDQNQDNKEFYEAKFKEVMVSYEAIKSERKKNGIH